MLKIISCFLIVLLTACNSNSDLSSDTDILLDSSHGGGGAAWGLENCDACHAISAIHKNENNIRDIVKENGQDTCTGCHGNNGTAAERQCIICHNDNNLPKSPLQSGKHKHDFDILTNTSLQDTQCIDCHYASDMDGIFEINRDLTRYSDKNGVDAPYTNGADFCLRCHNRDHQQANFPIIDKTFNDLLVAIEDSYTRIDKHGEVNSAGTGTHAGLRTDYIYGSRVECTDCHTMHGTDNKKLIIDRSDKGSSRLAPSIRNQPYSVQISENNYSQLCVLCHEMQTLQNQGDIDTGNGLSGVHITGSSCIECHSHGEAIQAGL